MTADTHKEAHEMQELDAVAVEKAAKAIFEKHSEMYVGPHRWENDPSHWRAYATAALASAKPAQAILCDCELSHNGLGMAARAVSAQPARAAPAPERSDDPLDTNPEPAPASAKAAQAGEVEALAKRLDEYASGRNVVGNPLREAAAALRAQAGEVDRLTAERNAALEAFANGAYADACKNGGGIYLYQHALALAVERMHTAEARADRLTAERDEAVKALESLTSSLRRIGEVLAEQDWSTINGQQVKTVAFGPEAVERILVAIRSRSEASHG